jgi:hypothetical protein
MQPRPSFDRELLIVIAIGVLSILGLGWIFLANYRSEPPISPTVESTAIPFDFSTLETGTPPFPPSTPIREETLPAATGTSPEGYPGPPAETLPSAGTLIIETRPIPSATSTPVQGPPLSLGKHDDTDPNIAYDRGWSFIMNPGTKNAYQGTLHISTSIGNEASFRFTGERFSLGYQRGRNFGRVTVLIDGQSYSFHEQAFDRVWFSPQLSPGTHSVRIIHESGESINLDYVEVLR